MTLPTTYREQDAYQAGRASALALATEAELVGELARRGRLLLEQAGHPADRAEQCAEALDDRVRACEATLAARAEDQLRLLEAVQRASALLEGWEPHRVPTHTGSRVAVVLLGDAGDVAAWQQRADEILRGGS